MADHPCEGSCPLGRRDFLGAAALTALALLESACGDGQIGPSGPSGPSGGNLVVTLAQYAVLTNVGGVARVDGGSGTPVALVRTGAQSFTALSLVCPHEHATVNVNGGGFLCPNHGARFSGTGVWQGGQPTTNMRSLPASYDAVAGTVTITR
ncbi:MAG TPA: Rieske 2Fe-2S domain-containing protein [Gemmatimonadaceae bacterium]|jgi:cytochrome b6-f complex iron-sulfur subunit